MNYYIKFLILLSGLVCKLATADVTFVHSDLLGSPAAETNLSGKLITLSHYKPFGEELEQKRDDVGFTAHKYDTDLALNYMQARYYDPVIGRFYSNDPIGFRDVHSFNRYAYANNNPYRYVDPDGKAPDRVVARRAGAIAELGATVVKNTSLKDNAVGKLFVDTAARIEKVQKLESGATLKPGKFASESVPARGPTRSFTKQERAEVNKIGKESGCHTCGSKDPGTKSGNFVPDHQPPNALNTSGGAQKLYPHCKSCSSSQGGQVAQEKRKQSE